MAKETCKGPQYIYGTPIKQLEHDAARLMLAALLEYRRCGLRNDAADAAIAAADAAGIKPSTGA